MGTHSQPLVTVYIPTYNRVELLKRAVKSVREQTYQNLEIIIVDDCSTDGTQDYLKLLATEDKRVRYFLKEKNSGACVSRNIAIEHATGEFITGLDDDDYFMENRIDSFIAEKDQLKKYEFLYALYFYKNKKGIHISKSEKLKPNKIKAKDLLSLNYVNNQIFTTTARLKSIGFNENMPAWQDLYTWYGLLIQNGGKAKLVNKMTYVMDTSHEYERISTKKILKIKEAYSNFSYDYGLSKFDQKVLFSQLVHYSKEEKKILYIFYALLNSLSLQNFFSCIYRLIK